MLASGAAMVPFGHARLTRFWTGGEWIEGPVCLPGGRARFNLKDIEILRALAAAGGMRLPAFDAAADAFTDAPAAFAAASEREQALKGAGRVRAGGVVRAAVYD
jgi:hypothetical protein